MKKIFIIDASGYLYRSYFAIRQMTNAKGESTNALFGFIRSVLKLMKDFEPAYLVTVFDGPANATSRTHLYADYKAHRKSMPSDLLYQIAWAQQFCQLLGLPELMIPGVEADDTMGSVALWAADLGATAYLCTSDKDMCQLVNDRILVLNTFKENQILNSEGVVQQFGVLPQQMVDYLAIVGDASDNVPGLTGFGPKTAADLLKQFGSLDELLEHPDLVSGKKKQETLIQEKEKVLLSRRLVTLDTSVPFTREMEFFKIGHPNISRIREFYSYMNFASLLRDFETQIAENKKIIEVEEAAVYEIIDDLEKLNHLMTFLLQHNGPVCIDTATTNFFPFKTELVGIGLGIKPKHAWYIPTNCQLDLKTIIQALKPLFENSAIRFIGHNLKFDQHVLECNGLPLSNIGFDTILASYILNSHSRQHSLDHLTLEHFGKVKPAIQDLIGKGKQQLSLLDVPIEKVSTYCCEDVDYTLRLKEIFTTQLKERNLEKLYYEIELPLINVLTKMERNGIFIDRDTLHSLSKQLEGEIEIIAEAIYELSGERFNLNSPKQLSQILFEKMGIHPPKKTATGLSTNAEVLESIKEDHPIAAKLLDYRTLEKLRSTYVDALPLEVNPNTGRIHCNFNQTMAATGRLSCQDPNLQNIPVRTEIGRKIREAFRPQFEGWSYLAADYSQIELRILAHLSKDPILMAAFLQNEDIHAFTASQMFNIPLDQVTREQRYQAKTVNFGIMYGQQAFGLSKELGIDPKIASLFIQKYFERYQKVKEFIEHCKESTRQSGKAITLFGRERLIPEIHSTNANIRMMAERLAVNTPIQGTQADIIKIAMLEIDKKLDERKLKSFMVLQIHDELVFEVPNDEIETVKTIVHDTMTQVIPLNIPLIVDINIGKNWKEC